ncbi:hypothetical protein EVC30_094 [Rhizobium phage RHph_Y1_11]|nr:hypothetical protein EVC30_094 [Rhizobium phage RHph_Y1_11]
MTENGLTLEEVEALQKAMNGKRVKEVHVWPQIIEIRMKNGRIVELGWSKDPAQAFYLRIRE